MVSQSNGFPVLRAGVKSDSSPPIVRVHDFTQHIVDANLRPWSHKRMWSLGKCYSTTVNLSHIVPRTAPMAPSVKAHRKHPIRDTLRMETGTSLEYRSPFLFWWFLKALHNVGIKPPWAVFVFAVLPR